MRPRTIRHRYVAFGLLLAIPLSVFCSNVPCWRAHETIARACPYHQNVDWLRRGVGGYF